MTSCSPRVRETSRTSHTHSSDICSPCTGAAARRSLYARAEERTGARLSVSTMSTATASVADVSGTDLASKDDRSSSGRSQCTPVPLPALGTQRIIQGNGTNVGTVISLQCPAKHKLVGNKLTCIMDINSTRWDGETYCKPLSPYEDHGFRVAVLASIVSSAIIFFMSVAFITCCLLDCIKEDKRKKQERESDVWQWEEPAQQAQQESRSRYVHKGRNNNNNNGQEKVQSLWDPGHPALWDPGHSALWDPGHSALWDPGHPALCDSVQPCRCQQRFSYGPACTSDLTPPLAALPGHDYDQPLLPRNPESGPHQHPRPPAFSRQTPSSSLVQISAVESDLLWPYGGQQSGLSEGNPGTDDQAGTRNIYRNKNCKEFSIRIISV